MFSVTKGDNNYNKKVKGFSNDFLGEKFFFRKFSAASDCVIDHGGGNQEQT